MQFKYIGIMFTADNHLHVACSFVKRKFFADCSTTFTKCKYVNDMVQLHLVKSCCLPLLTYCIGAIDLPKHKVKDLGVCWISCLRQIFRYNEWDSVAEVQYFFLMNFVLNTYMIYVNGIY